MTFDNCIHKLKEVYSKVGSSARVDDYTVNKTIFLTLDEVRESVEYASEKSYSNLNLAVLEDVCSGTNVILVRSTLINLVAIYTAIIKKTPGYIIRNILNAMLGICNNKTTTNISKECAMQIINEIMIYKSNDCANQITDIIQLIARLTRINDLPLKISCFHTILSILTTSGLKITDLHLEILKLILKFCSDKSVEIRTIIANIMSELAVNSMGFTTISMEQLLNPSLKGLEEDISIIQNTYANTIAVILYEQINNYINKQEQLKIDLARGQNNKIKKPISLSQRMSITKLSLTTTKKLIEEYDFKSVIQYILQQFIYHTSSNTGASISTTLGTGYIQILYNLIKKLNPILTSEEHEWLVVTVIDVLNNNNIQKERTYEEHTYIKIKFSYLFRNSIIDHLSETNLISVVNILIKHITTIETNNHSDLQLNFILNEISYLVGILGMSSIVLVENVNMGVAIYLRHSNFSVRSAAAQVLGNLALSVPALATEFLRGALLNTQSQLKQLLQFDPIELLVLNTNNINDNTANSTTGNNLNNNETNETQLQLQITMRKKSSKELERLQRIYFFHGHTLIISILIKNAGLLPSGLPVELTGEVYRLGLELISQDIMSVPVVVRHVVCSIIRAGSLILSSCISSGCIGNSSTGKGTTKGVYLSELIEICDGIFHTAAATTSAGSPHTTAAQPPVLTHSTSGSSLNGTTVTNTGKTDELVYEVMVVEAALVCISTILRTCPEILISTSTAAPTHLSTVVQGLELAFKMSRNKYQPKLRSHFRFRTMHTILLECFALLPAGSFPHSCQSLFVEALRVFRDGVALGYETTLLPSFVATTDHFTLTSIGAGQYSTYNPNTCSTTTTYNVFEAPTTEENIMNKLEYYTTALQKKENEAFLSIFSKEIHSISGIITTNMPIKETNKENEVIIPCIGKLDSRCMNSAIILLSLLFPTQSIEYQDKAIQLCSQALIQFSKNQKERILLFSSVSEEERRRKERMHYSTIKNVLATLSMIIHYYPATGSSGSSSSGTSSSATTANNTSSTSGSSTSADIVWYNTIITILYDMLNNNSYLVRSACAHALQAFSTKATTISVVSLIGTKIRSSMMKSLEKKTIDSNSALDNAGYLVALSSLWCACKENESHLKSLISTTVFDSMRKVSSSLPFRAQGFLTLSVFAEEYLTQYKQQHTSSSSEDTTEAVDLLDKTLSILELHMSNLHYTSTAPALTIAIEEFELFQICLLRLTNVCTALSLALLNLGSNLEINTIHTKFNNYRTGIYYNHKNMMIRSERISFFRYICSIDHTSEIYTIYLLKLLKEIMQHREDYTVDAITLALTEILPIIKKHPEEVCKMGLDNEFFLLLDYYFSQPTRLNESNTYVGLEFSKHAFIQHAYSSNILACISVLTQCINSICVEYIKISPNTRIIPWILKCRSMILNTTTSTTGNDSSSGGNASTMVNAAAEEGDDDEEEAGEHPSAGNFSDPTTASSNPAQPGAHTHLTASMTYITYTAAIRDYCSTHNAPVLQYNSIYMKYIAIESILLALSLLQDTHVHTNLTLSRQYTETSIQKISSKYTTIESLAASVPQYLALYLTDLINLTSTCATYMIDEHPILILQTSSMLLLSKLTELFLYTDDPDTKMTQPTSNAGPGGGDSAEDLSMVIEGRLLHQFTSQLTSAVRNGLAQGGSYYQPQLLYNTGALLCRLVQGGYITDKVVVRRLLKPILNYCEHGGIVNSSNTSTSSPAGEGGAVLSIQAPHSAVVSAEQSVILHYTFLSILAEVYTLVHTSNTQQAKCIFPSVRATIASMVAEHKDVLASVWWAMVVDTARIVWHSHTTAVRLQPKPHSGAHDLDALFGKPASAASTEPSTPGSAGDSSTVATLHPLRGGLTYTSTAALMNANTTSSGSSSISTAISQYLIATLPTVADAYLLSTRILKQKQSTGQLSCSAEYVLPLYSVLTNSFTSYFHENLKNTTSTVRNTNTANSSRQTLQHFLSSFLLLAQYDAYLSDTTTNDSIYLIPDTEWIEFVSLLMTQCDSVMQYPTTIHILIELLTVLADRLPSSTTATSTTTSSTADALWDRMWRWSMLLLHRHQPALFSDFSTAAWCAPSKTMLPQLSTSIHTLCAATSGSSSELLIPLVNILCKLANTKIAVSPIISHILALLLLSTATSSSSSSADQSALVRSLCNTQNIEILPNICLQLQQYIHDYLLYACTTTAMECSSTTSATSNVIDFLLQAWRAVALKTLAVQNTIPESIFINILILNTTTATATSIVLNSILKYIQLYNSDSVYSIFMSHILPTLLLRLSFHGNTAEVNILLTKALLLVYNYIPNLKKSSYIELILTPLCNCLAEHQSDVEFITICGHGITHIARQDAEVFRAQVGGLGESQRAVLQSAMKLSLQQQQQQHAATTNSGTSNSGSSGNSMAINMSKYKK